MAQPFVHDANQLKPTACNHVERNVRDLSNVDHVVLKCLVKPRSNGLDKFARDTQIQRAVSAFVDTLAKQWKRPIGQRRPDARHGKTMAAANSAEEIIEKLGLAPHPEGGWFRETWRTAGSSGGRATATAIYFLLGAGERSHWHRVDADELWLWHAGQSLTLSIASGKNETPQEVVLGPSVISGETPQALVPAGQWQAATPNGGWALMSCIVSPGFEFSGFELAPEAWEPGAR